LSKRVFIRVLAGLLLAAPLVTGCGKKEVPMTMTEEETQERMRQIDELMKNVPPEQRQRMEELQKSQEAMQQKMQEQAGPAASE